MSRPPTTSSPPGLVTHNSIYRFRGAEVGNMNEFVRDFGVEGGGEARAELPLAGPHPRRGQRDHRAEQGAPRQEPLDRRGQGRAAARLRRRQRRRGGALHRRRGEAAASRGHARSPRWRCSTAPTPSRASSSTRSSAPSSPTRSTAGLRFFERQEVKHALAYLRLAANPDDDTAFTRVVNFPPRGIGARSIEQLQEASERGMGSLMHVARAGHRQRPQRHRASRSSSRSSMRSASPPRRCALPELIEEILESSRLKEHYAAEKDGQDRLENLNELINAAALFAEDFEHGLEPAGEVAGGRGAPSSARPSSRCSPRSSRTRASRRASARRRGPGRAAADDGALRQGPRVLRGVHLGARGGPLPAREQHARGRRHRGGAPPHVRRDHARAQAPVPLLRRQPHAPRPAALRHRLALRRGDPAGAVQVDRAARRSSSRTAARLIGRVGGWRRRQRWGSGGGRAPAGRPRSLSHAAPSARGFETQAPRRASRSRSARTCATPSSARAW